MNKKIKNIGLVIIIVILYYCIQYASTAVHYNCDIIKDDCTPPIYWVSKMIYRVMVQPPWLDDFEIAPTVYSFVDGRFIFWEGELNRKTIVMRLREDESPVMRWVEQKLSVPVNIRPASGDNIGRWFLNNPEYKLRW